MRVDAEMTGGFEDHFSRVSRQYAAHRPVYPPGLANFLAELSPRAGLAWEAGCGSGQLTLGLARRFERVLATDPSAPQIENATSHPRVTYECRRCDESGLAANSADLAVAAQAAHWFDLPAYYAEVRRVARPGAAAALVGYGLTRVGARFDELVERLYSEILGAYWPPQRALVDAAYATMAFPFVEIQAPPMQMEAAWDFGEMIGYLNTWSAADAYLKREGRSAVAELEPALAAAWGDPASRRRVTWPLFVRAGRVT